MRVLIYTKYAYLSGCLPIGMLSYRDAYLSRCLSMGNGSMLSSELSNRTTRADVPCKTHFIYRQPYHTFGLWDVQLINVSRFWVRPPFSIITIEHPLYSRGAKSTDPITLSAPREWEGCLRAITGMGEGVQTCDTFINSESRTPKAW